ncbi:hypothetical protein JDV02_005239 [Purpureocillium takamizusanense]|uniref:Uncharacterized protein n=1 Tax=Purpureocillium takamizusanense TaxID=2060973 RepID=A0A9Q8QG50_9HYPO|nr:uncharacterized protein JDV02_005239 [Purpureocillium takamizusanense]UNI19020.1 hypothetical protein JDV02_005239 [Purpureocillium takamizusanense]
MLPFPRGLRKARRASLTVVNHSPGKTHTCTRSTSSSSSPKRRQQSYPPRSSPPRSVRLFGSADTDAAWTFARLTLRAVVANELGFPSSSSIMRVTAFSRPGGILLRPPQANHLPTGLHGPAADRTCM